MTDLQQLCIYALEDMNLKKLNRLYFDNAGIGWTGDMIAGKTTPVQFIQDMYAKRFPKKYHRKLAADKAYEKSFKGW